jgi:3-methyladenine DNA glycosylase AlkD
MDQRITFQNSKELASQIDAEIQALPVKNAPNERAVRRKVSKYLKQADPQFIYNLARTLLTDYGYQWFAYELIANHPAAFQRIGEPELEELGRGINSWWSVDSFARILCGPAWLRGQVSDQVIERWAHSANSWWQRAALVSTVALNVRSQGGRGDVNRTLAICRLLVGEHHDMVVKALSWALRALVVHDPAAVERFLNENDAVLATRVKREVKNKLKTGLKNPLQKRA